MILVVTFPESELSENKIGELTKEKIRRYGKFEFLQDYLGDRTCANNALSPYFQCGINPQGDCKTCVHYEKRKPL